MISLFGWEIPLYAITGGLFALLFLALVASRFSRFWENVLFKSAVAGFWALVVLWAVSSLIHFLGRD